MSFDYEKINQKQNSSTDWSSYSDLFMVLCCIFLLLYVVANMRNGTQGVQGHIEHQRLARESQDLKQQVKVYEALKEDYLNQQSNPDEMKVYKELMNKLTLLKEDAKDEKNNLMKQADENEKKEMALNHYQQVVRNIINTNLLAKAKIKRRDSIIVQKREIIEEQKQDIQDKMATIETQSEEIDKQEKDLEQKAQMIQNREQQLAQKQQTIQEKQQQLENKQNQIQNLEQDMEEKRKAIADNQQRIAQINGALDKKEEELKKTYQGQKDYAAKVAAAMEGLKKQSEAKIDALEDQNAKVAGELKQVGSQLGSAQDALNKTNAALDAAKQEKGRYVASIDALKKEKDGLAEGLGKAKAEQAQYEASIADLKKQKGSLEGDLNKAKGREGALMGNIEGLKKEKGELEGDLKKAQEMLAAKKKLAAQINQNLAKAGIKAQVDEKTGDVSISFGDEHFDTGQANLKPKMEETLQKFIPSYTEGLFNDPKVAEKISSVEIVGFASPTYKGKFIHPKSLGLEDKGAVQYNMDLSYKRAKSIFDYIFDQRKMQFNRQKQLLPLIKVNARGFLAEDMKGKEIPNGAPEKEFCKQFDCNQSQKVIIKFNIKE